MSRTPTIALVAACVAALAAAFCVAVWHPSAGVRLTPAEIGAVAAGASVLAAAIGCGLYVARVPAVAAALLPLALLQATNWLPITGKLRPHVDHTAAYTLLALAIACAFGLRSRFHRPMTLALGLFTITSMVAQRWNALPRTRSGVDHPPIVLLTLDTLRADHLAGFGGDVPTANTPNLDAFFKTARVFRHAYASIALTEPSHTTMLTGLGVEQHGVTINGQRLPDALPWVPEELQAAGWKTSAVVSAAVLEASLGLDRGFDTYDSTFEKRPSRAFAFLNWTGLANHAGTPEHRDGADTLALIDGFETGSFTWIHLYDAHWPYTPSADAGAAIGLSDVTPLPESGIGRQMNPSATKFPPEQVRRGKELYRASLQDLDGLVGRVLHMLPADAAIIVSGDHGESLDEHGYVFSHGRLPFATDVWTPLAVRAPGVAPEWVDTPVSLSAIAPTLRALAGLAMPTGALLPERGLIGPPMDAPILTVAYAEGFFGAQQPHPLGALAGIAIRQTEKSTDWTRWADPAAYAPITDPRELLPLAIEPGDQAALEQAATAAGHWNEPEAEMRPALEALGYLEPAVP